MSHTPNVAPETPRLDTNVNYAKPADLAAANPSDYRGPKVLLVGAGGCGINVARSICRLSGANMFLIDTGRANVLPGENLFVIGSGDGSGGVQDMNAEAAIKQMPTISLDAEHTPDIAIVCFSMSGGSGSFIGPYAIKHFLSKGILCVGIAVMDSNAVLQADNTVSALGNLDSLASKAKETLPIMVFNNKDTPRPVLDPIIAEKGRILVRMLTADTMEVDRNDRRHFLNGAVTHGATPGLRLLDVFETDRDQKVAQPLFPDAKADVLEAVLHIRGHAGDKLVDFPTIPELAQFRKDGYYREDGPATLGLISADLAPMNTPIKAITDLQERIDTHASLGSSGMNLPTKRKSKTAKHF